MIKEVYQKCHEEMMSEGDVDIIKGGEDINLAKKNNSGEKKCCA